MKVTDVHISLANEERLKAYVSITLDDSFVVRDIKIIKGPKGLFVAMPSKRRRDGTYKDLAHPLNQETRKHIEGAVFEAFDKAVDGLKSSSESSSSDEVS